MGNKFFRFISFEFAFREKSCNLFIYNDDLFKLNSFKLLLLLSAFCSSIWLISMPTFLFIIRIRIRLVHSSCKFVPNFLTPEVRRERKREI